VRIFALLAMCLFVVGCGSLGFSPRPSADPRPGPQFASANSTGIVFSSIQVERMSDLPDASPVDDARLVSIAEPYFNRPVSLEDLKQLGTDMEGVFRDEGYPYVRVVLPPQEVVNGNVRFQVIEGWVEGISVLGSSVTAKGQTEARLAELNGRGPLSLDDVERTVALLNRVPGLTSRVSIARGNQGPGAMRLIADATRKDPRVLLNVQNFGAKSLGREGTTMFAHVPGWAPFGDELEVALYNTWEPDEQLSGQVSYLRTLTPGGLTVKVRGAYAEAQPSGAVAVLGPSSESVTGGIEFDQPLLLTREDSLSAYAGLDYADLNGELFQGTVPLSEDKTRVFFAGVDGEAVWGGWRFSANLEGRQGLGVFDASAKGDVNLARTEANPEARVARGELAVTSPSIWGLEGELEIKGQYATDPLMAIEEFSFGNYGIGRGYDPGAAAGDSAIAGAFTLTGFNQQFWGDRVGAKLLAFYDLGRYWNEDSTGVPARTLASAGGGVRIVLNEMVRADVTYAHPLDQPQGIGESRPGGRVLFSITADGMAFWHELASIIEEWDDDPAP
jgi:hemolysin activation/secretion protein